MPRSVRTSVGRLRRSARQYPGGGPTVFRATLALAMFLLGLKGFQQVYQPQSFADWSDCLFRTGQLVVGQFPSELVPGLGDPHRAIPVYLNLARFALPLLALWFAVSALIKRIRQPLRSAGAGLLSDHLVFAGAGETLPALLAEAKREKRRAVVIGPAPAPADLAGAIVVPGDPSDVESWRQIGLSRARAVVITGMKDGPALSAALAATEVARAERPATREPLGIVCSVDSADLRALLDSVFRGQDPIAGVVLHATSPARVRARALLSRHPLYRGVDVEAGEGVHALIVGFGRTGEEVALQVLKTGIVDETTPPRVTVVDPDATRLGRAWRERLDHAAPLDRVTFIDAAIDPADRDALAELLDRIGAVNAMYVCPRDDTQALLIAVAIRRVYAKRGAGAPPLYCYQRDADDLSRHFSGAELGDLDLTRIHGFGHAEARRLESLTGETLDRRARQIHEAYLAEFGGGGAESQRPWPLLGDLYRQANRDQADYLPMRLACLGLREVDEPGAVSLSAEMLERAARSEHARWATSAELIGWRLGARDNPRQLHPDLAPYERLSEIDKAKDRAVIRNLASLLARHRAGLRAVETLALTADPGGDAAEQAKALLRRVRAVSDTAPVVVAALAAPTEVAVLRRAAARAPDLVWRLRLAPDAVARIRVWPAAQDREDARWLVNHADQVLFLKE